MEIHFFMCMSILNMEFSDDVGEQQFSHSYPWELLPLVLGPGPQGQFQQDRAGGFGGRQGAGRARAAPRRVLGNDGCRVNQ